MARDDTRSAAAPESAPRTERLDLGEDRPGHGPAPYPAPADVTLARQRDRYGGVKIGSAFFGWLAATGMAVLLIALLAAAGTAIGLSGGDASGQAGSGTGPNQETVGIVGAVALLVVLFVAYFCGGYVAGRMSRFGGGKQGFAVWLWGLLVALLVAGLGAVAGRQYDVLARLNSMPRLPVNEGDLTTAGIIAAAAIAAVSLLGAVLGGRAGMRFHRRVDLAGFPDSQTADRP